MLKQICERQLFETPPCTKIDFTTFHSKDKITEYELSKGNKAVNLLPPSLNRHCGFPSYSSLFPNVCVFFGPFSNQSSFFCALSLHFFLKCHIFLLLFITQNYPVHSFGFIYFLSAFVFTFSIAAFPEPSLLPVCILLCAEKSNATKYFQYIGMSPYLATCAHLLSNP